MWSTDQMPVDNSPSADNAQREGFVKRFNAKFSHRTQTMDYDIVLSGEIELILDDREVVHLRTGDVIILRGGTHTWHNTGSTPAVTAFILVDALPVRVDDEILEPLFPAASLGSTAAMSWSASAPRR